MVYSTHEDAANFDNTTPFYLPEHGLVTIAQIGISYLLCIYVLGKVFKVGVQKENLALLMCIYNAGLSLLSLYMFFGFYYIVKENWAKENYDFSLFFSDPELKLSKGTQWFYLLFYWSKYVEYMDTLWTVLLGKFKANPRCILQVYHHFVTPSIVYLGLYFPWGSGWTGPVSNTFVHIIMYAYYSGSYFFKQKWYRKMGNYIFMVQMAQFFGIILLTCFVLYFQAYTSLFALLFVFSQYFAFVGLFIAFYIFRQKEMKVKKAKQT